MPPARKKYSYPFIKKKKNLPFLSHLSRGIRTTTKTVYFVFLGYFLLNNELNVNLGAQYLPIKES